LQRTKTRVENSPADVLSISGCVVEPFTEIIPVGQFCPLPLGGLAGFYGRRLFHL